MRPCSISCRFSPAVLKARFVELYTNHAGTNPTIAMIASRKSMKSMMMERQATDVMPAMKFAAVAMQRISTKLMSFVKIEVRPPSRSA